MRIPFGKEKRLPLRLRSYQRSPPTNHPRTAAKFVPSLQARSTGQPQHYCPPNPPAERRISPSVGNLGHSFHSSEIGYALGRLVANPPIRPVVDHLARGNCSPPLGRISQTLVAATHRSLSQFIRYGFCGAGQPTAAINPKPAMDTRMMRRIVCPPLVNQNCSGARRSPSGTVGPPRHRRKSHAAPKNPPTLCRNAISHAGHTSTGRRKYAQPSRAARAAATTEIQNTAQQLQNENRAWAPELLKVHWERAGRTTESIQC
jgi:hypothetical protein